MTKISSDIYDKFNEIKFKSESRIRRKVFSLYSKIISTSNSVLSHFRDSKMVLTKSTAKRALMDTFNAHTIEKSMKF